MSKAKSIKSLTSLSKKEVRAFFSNSSIIHYAPYCIIRKQLVDTDSKLLIAIPKSVGSAPHRNLYRRRLKHIFYENQLFCSGAIWGIFIKKNAILPSYKVLKQLMLDLMGQKEV